MKANYLILVSTFVCPAACPIFFVLVGTALAMFASIGSSAEAANGEGFFSVSMSNNTEAIDIIAVHPDTLLPLPSTFNANEAGEYALSGLLVVDGDTINPFGNFELTGLGDPFIQTRVKLFFPDEATGTTPTNLFASFLAGIQIVPNAGGVGTNDFRIESIQTTTTTGDPGTSPASALISTGVFLDTPDGKEAPATMASVSGPAEIPGVTTIESGSSPLPPIPADSTETSFDTLVTQVDFALFDIDFDTNYDIDVTSRTEIIIPPPSNPGDYNMDGVVNGKDFLYWQRGLSPIPLSASDLVLWSTHYGQPSAFSTTVPEPSSLLLASLVGLFIGRVGGEIRRGGVHTLGT